MSSTGVEMALTGLLNLKSDKPKSNSQVGGMIKFHQLFGTN